MNMMKTQKIDPITLQVIRGSIETIAEEMAHVLFRMSFSSIIRESEDLGAGLFDKDFNTLCESESTPMHIGSIPGYLNGIKESLDDGQWFDGDVVVHNHPYFGASHTPDLAIVIPIFYQGELVGYSANTAHHIDIGAATPGLIIDVPDVYAEGMLFAGTKLYRKGKRNETMWNYIRRNSRAARQLVDDIEAQIASARLGAKRFKELLDRYGKELVFGACNQLMDYSEAMLRQRIAAIPDGEYRAEGWLDDDGRNRGQHLPVKVCVRVDEPASGGRSAHERDPDREPYGGERGEGQHGKGDRQEHGEQRHGIDLRLARGGHDTGRCAHAVEREAEPVADEWHAADGIARRVDARCQVRRPLGDGDARGGEFHDEAVQGEGDPNPACSPNDQPHVAGELTGPPRGQLRVHLHGISSAFPHRISAIPPCRHRVTGWNLEKTFVMSPSSPTSITARPPWSTPCSGSRARFARTRT